MLIFLLKTAWLEMDRFLGLRKIPVTKLMSGKFKGNWFDKLDNSLPESSVCITGIKRHEAMSQVILNHILQNREKNK